MNSNLLETLKLTEQAVLSAAKYQIETLTAGTDLNVTKKSDSSLVTLLDIESQKIIKALLSPHGAVVAEEDENSHKEIENCSQFFLVDPVDGTTACKRFTTYRGGQVGFGPLVGFANNGQLQVASFFSVPQRLLITAVRDQGCFAEFIEDFDNLKLPEILNRKRLQIGTPVPLDQSAILFHSFTGEELPLVSIMMKNKAVETAYRFGGFASDCARLAQGFEQVHIQYTVKAWDFTGTLFEREAGIEIVCDPLRSRTSYDDWKVAQMNPIIGAQKLVMPEVLSWLEKART